MSPRSGKPLKQLQKLARLLEWPMPLLLCQHHVKEKDAPPDLRGKVLTWYEAGAATGRRDAFFLQINESPPGQAVAYHACVYAVRYRIHSGWRKFRLSGSDDDLEREAARLRKWLAWDWFASAQGRRAFRQVHPECAGYSWRTIRKGGPKEERSASLDTAEDGGTKSLVSRKPLKRLQRMAHLLGWQTPLWLHQSHYSGVAHQGLRGKWITWYRTGTATGGKNDCFLHIRELPLGQTVAYDASVYAPRYQLRTGFHSFRLSRRDDDLKCEIARLAPWLAWDWFATIEKRRMFRQAHPECMM